VIDTRSQRLHRFRISLRHCLSQLPNNGRRRIEKKKKQIMK